MGNWTPALPTFPCATCSWPRQAPRPSSLEDLRVGLWSQNHCSDSLLSPNPASRFPPPQWLHVQQVLPGDTAPVMPPSPALGSPRPCQPGCGPQGSITPWVSSSKALAFQPDTRQGLCFQLQHPAWRVLSPAAPAPPASSSCSLPVVLLSRSPTHPRSPVFPSCLLPCPYQSPPKPLLPTLRAPHPVRHPCLPPFPHLPHGMPEASIPS